MMQIRSGAGALVLCAAGSFLAAAVCAVHAQSGGTRQGGAATVARGTAAARETTAASTRIESNLLQVMRGIVYPASNVVFAAQEDLSTFKPVSDPSTSPNPITSTYGGWTAVENAAIALAESANLLSLPGRVCSNGKPVPIQRADWAKFTQGLRDAGRAAYKAAQSKNQDAMVDASGSVADACSACHDVYREKKSPADRCIP